MAWARIRGRRYTGSRRIFAQGQTKQQAHQDRVKRGGQGMGEHGLRDAGKYVDRDQNQTSPGRTLGRGQAIAEDYFQEVGCGQQIERDDQK